MDIKVIQCSIIDLSDALAFYQAQAKNLVLCESLMKSYVFIEKALDGILNAKSFACLKILQYSLISPTDLVYSLQKISQSMHKNNLLLPISCFKHCSVRIIELEAFHLNNRITFSVFLLNFQYFCK